MDPKRRLVVSFGTAALALGALVWFVGVDEFLAALGLLDTAVLLVLAALSLCWLVAWGQALRSVLGALDVPLSASRATALYTAAAFANNVTPFGQAGGEPLAALLIARATNSSYERSLAAIASVDALNFVPSTSFALVGLAYYALAFTVDETVAEILAVVLGLVVVIPAAGYLLWRRRRSLAPRLAAGMGAVFGVVGRVVPRVSFPDEATLRERIAAFVSNLERVGRDRRALAAALGFSGLGWAFSMASLWVVLRALGYAGPPWVVLVVIPVGRIAGVTPLPGGLGGVEFALVLLIVPLTGLSPAVAASAALVYRGATYWFVTGVGGLAAAWLQGRVAVDAT